MFFVAQDIPRAFYKSEPSYSSYLITKVIHHCLTSVIRQTGTPVLFPMFFVGFTYRWRALAAWSRA